MSEIGLNINVDSYNNEGIKTIKGNNNAEIYKLYILKNKRRLNLVGKTVKLGYVMAGTTKGDIIEDLNITNAEQGEITLPITNRISKKDGVYSCQLAIYREDEFLEYTATFGLTVEANIFTKIAGEIENSKDLTYIERILEEATNISEELKSNIPVARQLNSDLENQNRILNENMDRANGVNNTLITTTEQSKVAATDAIEKKGQLEKSITKAKEFIDGLDGSQNIPGIRMELTELQNGLKSNQALAYQGSSINAENTLEGRTEGMRIGGRTLINLFAISRNYIAEQNKQCVCENDNKDIYTNKQYSLINLISKNVAVNIYKKNPSGYLRTINIPGNSIKTLTLNENEYVYSNNGIYDGSEWNGTQEDLKLLKQSLLVLEGDWTNKPIPSYFEGIKSFGEAEQEGDKYKISILSNNENYFKLTNDNIFGIGTTVTVNGNSFTTTTTNGWNQGFGIQVDRIPSGKYKTVFEVIENKDKGVLYEIEYFKDNNSIKTMPLNYVQYEGVINVENIDYDYFKLKFKNGREQSPIGYKYLMLVPYDLNINTYIEKKTDKKDILIKEPLREGDCLYEDNGQVKVCRDVKQYTFTGDESFRILQPKHTNTLSVIVENIIDSKCTISNIMYRMCNNFFIVDTNARDIEGYNVHLNSVRFNILKSKLNTPDIEGFKAWLKANPTTIVYQLATPTVEIVENCVDIDLDTYQEKTYFNILNSLPGTLDFKVPSNIGSMVQNMAKEVNNIWDVINNLLVPGLIDVNKTVAMATIKNNLQ